jgi:release factor glutamine methyltransferase
VATNDPTSSSATRFGPLRIGFDDRVLRPRQWTMMQAQWAADLLVGRSDPAVLELCCGAGHIGLATSALLGGARLVLVDVSAVAADWAMRNTVANDLALTTQVVHADLISLELGMRFDLVMIDPPYLTPEHVDRYPEDPALAVDGGIDGLAVVLPALATAARHLAPGGEVLLQVHGRRQADEVVPLLAPLELRYVELRCEDDARAVMRLRGHDAGDRRIR